MQFFKICLLERFYKAVTSIVNQDIEATLLFLNRSYRSGDRRFALDVEFDQKNF